MHTDWVPVVSAPLIGIYSLTMTLEQMTHLRDGELHFQSHLVDYGNWQRMELELISSWEKCFFSLPLSQYHVLNCIE